MLRSLSLSDSLIQSEETDMLKAFYRLDYIARQERNTAVWQRKRAEKAAQKRRSGSCRTGGEGKNTWAGRIR